MTYQETLDFLYSQVPMFQNQGAGAYKPGLDTTLALARHWGNPHKRISKCIHIGGTNGKGSTAHTIAAILQSAGYRTALYTSPHLLDFRERIRIDGKPIEKDFVVDFVAEYLRNPELTQLAPTFFELTTIMALKYFADADVDVAVIEVGLGGRLDCTNIITPCLSIITNISLDHTALLGHTEPEIAHEKAGIIKAGIPVVIGRAQGEVKDVFNSTAEAKEAPIYFASECDSYSNAQHSGRFIEYSDTEFGTVKGELTGACQKENAATILTALSILKNNFKRIDSDAACRGFASVCSLTGLAGRWMEVASDPVRVICDTGHNIGGWQHLGPSLCELAQNQALHMVIGFVNDKDIASIMELLPKNATYYFASPSVKRGRPSTDTQAEAIRHGLNGAAFETVKEGYEAAIKAATPGSTVFVGGSTFIVADFLAIINPEE